MPDPAYAGLGAWRLLLTHYLMLREKAASLLSMRDLKKWNGGWCIKSAVKRNICIIDSLTRGLESLSSLFDKEKKKKKPENQKKRKTKMNSWLKNTKILSCTSFPLKSIFLWNVVHCSKQILSLPKFMLDGYCRDYSWILNFICEHLYSAVMANKRKTLHTNIKRTFGKVQLSSRPSSKK